MTKTVRVLPFATTSSVTAPEMLSPAEIDTPFTSIEGVTEGVSGYLSGSALAALEESEGPPAPEEVAAPPAVEGVEEDAHVPFNENEPDGSPETT